MYYAEHNTDKIIRETYFPDFNYKGVIVEVGGATPEFLSMSKHFKDNGWRTIVFEPNPTFAKQHREAGNEIYEIAISNEDLDNQDFTIVKQNVSAYGGIVTDHSFSSISVKDEYIEKTGFKLTNENSEVIKVNIRRLESVLDIKEIDILSIDTEGWELEVMKGIDTNKINCKVIVMENLFHNPEYTEYMKSIGYFLDNKIEYNYIYIKND